MYFKLKCPHCDHALKVRQELAGQKRNCPYCQKALKIPTEATNDFGLSDLDAPSEGGFPDLSNLQTESISSRVSSKNKPGTAKSKSAGQTVQKTTVTETGHESEFSDPSDVGLVTTGLIGLSCAALFMGLMFAIRSTYLGSLFVTPGKELSQGTVIQMISSILFFWNIAILVLKSQKLKRQRQYLLMDVLPTEISREITIATIDPFVSHIHGLPGDHGESFLLNRVRRGLEHFRVRKSAAETVTMMSSQAEIDSNNVDSSYTALRVLIWAIPIMGFVGTVLGLSVAIAELASAITTAADVAEMQASLKDLFDGLGTAFNTTLVALVMSIVIKFPMSALQKSEEGVLNWVDEYCNENLLRRLNDGLDGGAERGGTGPLDTKIFKRAVEEAMATQQAELEIWTKKLETVGVSISNEVVKGWEEINQKIIESQKQLATELQADLQQKSMEVSEQQTQQQAVLTEQLTELKATTQNLQETLQNLSSNAHETSTTMTETVSNSAEQMQTYFAGIEKGLTSLSSVLENLGEERVVVQQVEPAKRGWFSFGANGKKR